MLKFEVSLRVSVHVQILKLATECLAVEMIQHVVDACRGLVMVHS